MHEGRARGGLAPLVSEAMNRDDLEARTRGDDADRDRDGWLSRSEVGPALGGLLQGR